MRAIAGFFGAALMAATAGAQEPGESFRDCGYCPELVVVPASAEVPSFALGRFEVTWDEWTACVDDGACPSPDDRGWGQGRQPVINVTWRAANGYVSWLSEQTGRSYRLPTAAEWTHASLAGGDGPYSWGDAEPVCDAAAVNGANFAACTDDRTHPVGSYPPNAFGLHDMHGNVMEWTGDCYGGEDAPPVSGVAEGACELRILHGGSWINGQRTLRSNVRVQFYEELGLYAVGFRVARGL